MATQFQPDQHCRVLIVEDEIAVAIHLEDLLLENGYEVLDIATSLAQALDCLDRHEPDAVLLDLDLHGQRATPVAVKLRQRGIPFVLETAEAPDALTGTPFQGAALVQKPWSERDVLRGLTSILVDQTACETAHSGNIFAFPATDRIPAKASGAEAAKRPGELKTDHAARPARLLPIKHEKIAAPHPAGSGSHFPGLPGTYAEHMDVHAVHAEAVELQLQPRPHVVPKGRKTTPGLPAGHRDIGLKQA